MRPDELYTPIERLPPFAVPAWATTQREGAIPAEAARAFLQHVRDLPGWVIAIAPVDAIKAAAA